MEEAVDTWGQLAPFAQTSLNRIAYNLVQNGKLNSYPLVFLLRPLEEVVENIGPDRSQVHSCFSVSKTPTQYRALWEHDSNYIVKIAVNSNVYLQPKPGSASLAQKLWENGKGKLMVAERTWLITNKLMSVYVSDGVLSNVWWPIVLKPFSYRNVRLDNEQHAKIQTLWLNSTFGLIASLSFRQDTRGAWIGLKKEILDNLPVLWLSKLNKPQVEELESAYVQLSAVEIPSIPQQFQLAIHKQGWRYELDKKLVEIVSGNQVDLTFLYEMISREPLISLKPLS